MNIAMPLLQRARASPSLPAITFGARSWSFGEIVDRASRLGAGLRAAQGLAAGDRVVLCMENRAEFLESLFACWIAGLVAVPTNAKLHAREVAHIVRDSGARALLTSESLEPAITAALSEDGLPSPGVTVAGSAAYARASEAPPMACAHREPTDTAWIFYTSGTTGRPKGAMLTHRNLMFMSLAYYADIERVEPGATKLHAAPLSHASGIYSLPHLFGGGHQVVLPGFDADDVLAACARYRDVTLFGAPTMVSRLVNALAGREHRSGLRTLYYGGGPMYVSDLQRALATFGPVLWQLYGQGESPMTITGLSKADHLGDGGPRHLARLASCGTARTGVMVRVVDAAGRDVPAGESGEVITRSDAVMAGYHHNAAANAAALRDGWLWTGDIGALDELGYLLLRDRSKDMIISGGSNIYPREIEECLLRHPGVLECSVVGRPHPDWGEEVVAFVVARPGQEPGDAEFDAELDAQLDAQLDALCLAHIARFKRPRQYIRLAALPKNNYGKVLKTELRLQLQKDGNDA